MRRTVIVRATAVVAAPIVCMVLCACAVAAQSPEGDEFAHLFQPGSEPVCKSLAGFACSDFFSQAVPTLAEPPAGPSVEPLAEPDLPHGAGVLQRHQRAYFFGKVVELKRFREEIIGALFEPMHHLRLLAERGED